MNVLTTAHPAGPTNTFGRMLETFLARMRHLIELAGAPYVNGPQPPL